MSYIDPDQLHGAVTNLGNFITNNAAAITAGGVTTATITAKATAIEADLTAKKGARDQQKLALSTAQQAFVGSATANYAAFSNLIDTVAGAVGKGTPAGQQVLSYRQHLNAAPQHHASQVTPAATVSK
jgi:hypothetical protein